MDPRTFIPLTAAQEGIWIGQALDPASAAYVTAERVEIEGEIDLMVLATAVAQALHEAEGLRARVEVHAHRAHQRLDGSLSLAPALVDVASRDEALGWMADDVRLSFDLTCGPLARQALLRISSRHVIWYLAAHHVALDGFAFSLLIQRAAEVYGAYVARRAVRPTPFSSLQTVVEADLTFQGSEQREHDRAFWLAQLGDMTEPAALCGVPPRKPALPRRIERQLDAAALLALDFSADRGPSWAHTLTALFAAYVQTETGGSEAVLGLPVLARVGAAALRAPSMLMNIVPLRLATHEGASPRDCADAASRALRTLLPHSLYRYEQLRRDLGRLGGNRRLFGPVLNIMPFSRQVRFADAMGQVHGICAGPVEDVSLSVHPMPSRGGLELTFEGHPQAYTQASLTSLADHFVAYAVASSRAPNRAIAAAATSSRADIVWRGEPVSAPVHDVLYEILECARHDGQRVALQHGGEVTSYGELVASASALAGLLRSHGVHQGECVALYLPRGRDAVVAMLAVLLCRAAYLPLDPRGPRERCAAILRAAEPTLVLVDGDPVIDFVPSGVGVVSLREAGTLAAPWELGDLATATPAYVIYTSGSTGVPNGVEVSRGALAHFVAAARQRYALAPSDRVLQFAPLAFDASVEEIFVTLATGACLVVRDDDATASVHQFLAHCRDQAITVLDLPTAFFHELCYALAHGGSRLPPSLRTIIIGGEAVLAERVRCFVTAAAGKVRLLNTYGPTEATVVALAADLSVSAEPSCDEPVSIGRPLPGVSALLRPWRGSVGVPRTYELWLSGPTLANGYLGNPTLTAQRFVALAPHGRAYHTGDLVRVGDDGQLVFVGRSDEQLKISGHRVELHEVELALALHRGVQEVAVVAVVRSGQPRLVAHVVPCSADLTVTALRDHARRHLLAAAIPGVFVLCRELPKTATGKLDRKQLGVSSTQAEAGLPPAPESALERAVFEVWSEVLGTHEIGLEQDFFELGGQSLQTIQVANRLGVRLGRQVAGALLFEHPTVRSLALALSDALAVTSSNAVDELRARVVSDATLNESATAPLADARARWQARDGDVLLTGATGYLGVQLLHELLRRTDHSVVCLVRADDEAAARQRLVAALAEQQLSDAGVSRRVRVLTGDLSKPRLGLARDVYRELGAQCSTVLHNGASVSLARGYASVRAVNVQATRTLIELAREAPGVSLHYVSTLAAALQPDGRVAERFVDLHDGLQDGYSLSKWASERLLEQASAQGLPVRVFRLGRLVGAMDRSVVNRDDLVWRLIAAGVRAGALPRLAVHEPWTPVDLVARLLVATIDDRAATETVFNFAPRRLTSLRDVMRWTLSFGYRASLLEKHEFALRVRQADVRADLPTLAMLERQSERSVARITEIETANTDRALARAGMTWPEVGEADLHRYLARCVETGLIPPPQAGDLQSDRV